MKPIDDDIGERIRVNEVLDPGQATRLFANCVSRGLEIERLYGAIEVFNNRRKLAHSLRVESPQIAAFVEAIGVEMGKALSGTYDEVKT